MTLQDMWAMDDPEMEAIREKYGKDYSDDAFNAYMKETFMQGFMPLQPGEPNCFIVDNSTCDIDGIHNLNKVLGIKLVGEPDLKAI